MRFVERRSQGRRSKLTNVTDEVVVVEGSSSSISRTKSTT